MLWKPLCGACMLFAIFAHTAIATEDKPTVRLDEKPTVKLGTTSPGISPSIKAPTATAQEPQNNTFEEPAFDDPQEDKPVTRLQEKPALKLDANSSGTPSAASPAAVKPSAVTPSTAKPSAAAVLEPQNNKPEKEETSPNDPKEIDYIVAVVGDEVITRRELDTSLQNAKRQLTRQNTALPPDDILERQMLERMIMLRLQLQFARETGVKIDDNQLNQALGHIALSNKMTVAEFRQALEKDGISYDKLRDQVREELTINRLREREVDSRLIISEAEVDNFLSNPAIKAGEEYHVAHILLRAPESASPEQIQKLKDRAEEIYNKLHGAQAFAELAAAYSDAPDALKGGDLGWRGGDHLPTLFTQALEKLKPGEVSPILRSANGFHILRLIDKRGGETLPSVEQTHARHILVRVDELVSEKEAEQKLLRLKERIDHGADFAELARQNSQDGSAPKGGDLGWLHPGDTVPDFQRAMDALKPNEISEPIRSPFGWHLIQVLERRTQDITDERKRQNARQALRDRKIDDAYQDWLRQLRDRVFVEIRLDDPHHD